MKEINIAKVITAKRKEKGITQDELADYIGVSKASVSKWETGLSYPDITLLPQLATYFNITIDELMEYSPQMTKKDIKLLYHKLATRFADTPFDEVMAECRGIIKKYYSCFPLLLNMAILYINHHMLTENMSRRKEILREAVELCERVKTQSDDVWLAKDAVHMQAICYLTLNEPMEVLDLLGGTIRPLMSEESLISQAYLLMGKMDKAEQVTQINMIQHLMALFESLLHSLSLYVDDNAKAQELLRRTLAVVDAFDMEHLNPNGVLLLYALGAKVYCLSGDDEKALNFLEKYVSVCTEFVFPYKLHGDRFFDSIDGWLDELDLGPQTPRNEKVIKESMLKDVLLSPDYAALAQTPRYKNLVNKLKNFVGGN